MTLLDAPGRGVSLPAFTAAQEVTFTQLLAVGGERPFAPVGLVEELRSSIESGTADALSHWTEKSFWLTKGQLFSALRCEEAFRADRETPRPTGKHPSTAVGDVTHRAIQLAHTHPSRPVAEYVRYAIASLRGSDEAFDEFYTNTDMATQSDVVMQATSRLTAFLDAWPQLADDWSPRFEETVQAKVGALTLSSRVDLVLGRPRTNGQQTMFIADWKSGGLRDHHEDEAMFYALVSTLRHGIPPFRSTVYSLASATFTDPDVTAEKLRAAAAQVVTGVNSMVDVLTERRAPQLTPGSHCTYCPLRKTCPGAATVEGLAA